MKKKIGAFGTGQFSLGTLVGGRPGTTIFQNPGHEATETGLAYAPVSQAHGHNHIVQCSKPGGGGLGGGGSHTRTRPGQPPVAITKKAYVSGVRRFGFGVHCGGLRCGGRLGTTVVQTATCHFTRQPQSILWHLRYAIDNALRQGTMQCPETCRMATKTINLPDEGRMHKCNCKCKGATSIQKLCPLILLSWLNAFLLGNQIHGSQILLVCAHNVWQVT